MLKPEIKKEYEKWINSPYIDRKDKNELLEIRNDEKEITDRFYQRLEFGTGGLRGKRGVGTNRINRYVVMQTTQGLANYMKKFSDKNLSVVLAHDSRIGSMQFTLSAAMVFAANGIKAYVFGDLRPTPELSFAVRKLKTLCGIVVTASHNPKEYNGYKVYWEDGCQIVAPHDKEIIKEVYKIDDFSKIKIMSSDEAKAKDLLEIIDSSPGSLMDKNYLEKVYEQQVDKDILKQEKDFKLVYTPLNGAGITLVPKALKEVGVKNLYIVKEQEEPDGNFPTIPYPNPENPQVFELGQKLADEKGAKYIIASDPDADRLGVSVKDKDGKWTFPSGNQVGILLLNYICKNMSKDIKKPYVVSTIVSTPLVEKICQDYKIDFYKTLTGFKNICGVIREIEERKEDKKFIFGFEESYGYLKGDYVRDKDSVISSILVSEVFALIEKNGSSVKEELDKLYLKYGYYLDHTDAITMEGIDGKEKIKKIVENLRENPPQFINNSKVVITRDYELQIEKDTVSGEEKKLTLSKSNVLQFIMEDDSYISIRPSGTEPKIKIYYDVSGKNSSDVKEKLKQYIAKFGKLALSIQ